jgi:hypothetical protein
VKICPLEQKPNGSTEKVKYLIVLPNCHGNPTGVRSLLQTTRAKKYLPVFSFLDFLQRALPVLMHLCPLEQKPNGSTEKVKYLIVLPNCHGNPTN